MHLRDPSFRASVLLLPLWSQNVWAQSIGPCPIINAYYPAPTALSSSSKVQSAIASTESQIQAALNNNSTIGSLDANFTAFSVDVFSLHAEDPLYTSHFLPDALASQRTSGVSTIDSNTIYRMGSVSKLWTAYLYLIGAGDATWNRPVTDFVPELEAIARENKASHNSVDDVSWCSITIGALASHMAGLARDVAYSAQIAAEFESMGLPSAGLNSHSTCGDPSLSMIPCNRTAFFEDFPRQHPVSNPFNTPAYSNAGYYILGYALENITGQSVSALFQKELVEPLGLNGTYYSSPPTADNGIVPFNTSISWWDADLLDEAPAGGYYSTVNDVRKIGKAILNSTLLDPAQTRRWMKPVSFTSNPNAAVGAPWEIIRAPGNPVSWMYTKSGDIGLYSTMLVLIPELDIGITVLAAGQSSDYQTRVVAEIAAANFVPAIWDQAADETSAVYAGTYTDETSNSTITVETTSDGQGIHVSNLLVGGQDVIAVLGQELSVTPKVRLYPMGLSTSGVNGTTSSWRAIFETSEPNSGLITSSCITWFLINQITYGGVGLDEFLFTLDHSGKSALSIEWRIVGGALSKI